MIHDTDTEFREGGLKNSAWSLNQSIWSKIEDANNEKQGLARRYVHITNFEKAHFIETLSGGKDKPLQAYRYVQSIAQNDVASKEKHECLRWLDDIVGKQEIVHDMTYVESNCK